MELYIEDAQYVYRDMPSSVKPAGWWGVPYFQNGLPEGVFIGSSGVTTPYNAYCYFHCDYRPWGGNPPAEDSGYDPKDKAKDNTKNTDDKKTNSIAEEAVED